jgi:hypothetical protein
LSDVFTSLTTLVNDASSSLTDLTNDLAQVTDALNKPCNNLNLPSAVESLCNGLGDVAKDVVKVALEGAIQVIQAAKDAINSLISAALQGFGIADGLASIISIHSFSVSGSIDATTTSFSFAAALDMTFFGQRFTESLTINMKDVAGELWSYLKEQFSGLSTLVSDCLAKYTEVASKANDALDDALRKIEEEVCIPSPYGGCINF